jgi:hypothetical protein
MRRVWAFSHDGIGGRESSLIFLLLDTSKVAVEGAPLYIIGLGVG